MIVFQGWELRGGKKGVVSGKLKLKKPMHIMNIFMYTYTSLYVLYSIELLIVAAPSCVSFCFPADFAFAVRIGKVPLQCTWASRAAMLKCAAF